MNFGKVSKLRGMEETEILAHADRLVEQIKENMVERERFNKLAQERIKVINEQLEHKTSKLDEWIEQCKFELLQIANISKTKETKTQRKLELLAGDVIIKKATTKLKNDNAAILEALKDERADLVKEKVTYSLDWATYKKELEIMDNLIINKNTGEVVEIEGLEVEEVPERLEVK
ncbi:MAG TPA: hypothetical protein GX707_10425 [Epulopiscium sp.]|nr:hypothetical protein [Candidatus Epulonipiscium sp.]